MISLHELQQRCYRAFLLGDPDSLLPELTDNAVPPITQAQVYQNNARETFRKALQASFPVVERLVGEACFRGLSLKYMREHPSLRGDLQRFGDAFPDFVDEHYGSTEFAYLPEVARLEWAVEEAHLEPDEEHLAVSTLQAVAPQDRAALLLKLRRATRLVSSRYPILAIWRANQAGGDGTADLRSGGEHVAVVRRGDHVELHRLDPVAYQLACQFARGASLQSAIETLGPADDDLGSRVAAAMQSLVSVGLIAGFSLGDSTPSN